ncbi:MAG: hypothetical protein LBB47_04220 [Spirochaetaceae bacterium]|jgi:hypothetical protein|nr:hypothetical protein [Spirochaetaceae bacterium]
MEIVPFVSRVIEDPAYNWDNIAAGVLKSRPVPVALVDLLVALAVCGVKYHLASNFQEFKRKAQQTPRRIKNERRLVEKTFRFRSKYG